MISEIILKRVIERLKNEVCPAHKQSVTLSIKNGMIIIGEYCCSDFYAHISARVRQEIEREAYMF